MKHQIIQHKKVQDTASAIKGGIKQSALLSGAWDGNYAVAVVVVDGIRPKAEVHEKAADVWRIEKGNGKFILGGKLVAPEKVRNGELAADEIKGGEVFEVAPGDIIDIPAGVAHQIDAREGRIELLIVKINK